MSKQLRRISIEEFARRLKVTIGAADKRFAFFLGAGCSVSSGVPHAGTLVKDIWLPRLRDLSAPTRKDLDAWASETVKNYDPKNPAAAYGDVIDHLFLQPEERQREIESLCDGRFPCFGYAVLSGMVTLERGIFNVVLTTNFDDLIADALYLFTTTRPLVIHHESLASYIRPTRTRPLIVKMHGDHRLSPQNTVNETETVKNEIEAHVRTLLHDRGLIFMGYGGNDKGMQKMFEALPSEALPLGVFWIGYSEPQGILRPWLESRNAIWVQKNDFDECMLVLRDELQIQHPERQRFDEVFERYTETYKTLSARIESLPDTSPDASVLKEAVRRTDQSFPDWRAVSLEADRLGKTDPGSAESVYQKGIEEFPQSGRLIANYAHFMRKIRRNKEAALKLYERAIATEGDDATVLCQFANFLHYFCKDYQRAESLYKRSVDLDPKDPFVLDSYARFLSAVRENYGEAEKVYSRGVSENPNNPLLLWGYGDFLAKTGRNTDQAEEALRHAAALDPSNSYVLTGLAFFLASSRQDEEGAETYFRRAVEAEPENSYALRSYAQFLAGFRNDYDAAEEFFLRAIHADVFDPGLLVYYAQFLRNARSDHDRAEEQFSRALALSTDDPTILVPYIDFLRVVRKNMERADQLEKRLNASTPSRNQNEGGNAIVGNS